MATVQALLQAAADLPSDCPRRDAEILLCHCLDKERAWVYTWPEASVEPPIERRYLELLALRRQGRPIAHLTGQREFWSLQLEVNQHTLIPRTETEALVEWALELPLPERTSVLDLGTGCGAIALALASERKLWAVSGLDASEQALTVARKNGAKLGLARVGFLHSNWYSAVASSRYHLLVSNPPYIAQNDAHLAMGDLPHEPQMALVSPDRGVADLANLIDGAPTHLQRDGWLLLEHGYDQGGAVRRLLQDRGFVSVQTRHDLAGHERVTGACWRA